jgi:CRP-like cAMP-binding protein
MRRREIGQVEDPALVERLTTRLREREHFSGLAAPLVEKLVRLGSLAELEKGEMLIREGEPSAAEIYLLIDGTLVVQSQAVFIARLDRPGDVVGEVAVLLSSKRTADVVAESNVQAVAIPSKVISLPEFAEVAAGIRQAMLRDDWARY